MKKNISIIVLLLTINSLSYCQNNYYWYNSTKVQLNVDSSIFYIKTADITITKPRMASIFGINDTTVVQLSNNTFIIKSDKKIDVSSLKSQTVPFKYNTPLFRNSIGASFVFLPQIIVQLKVSHSIKEVLSLYDGILSVIKSKGFNTYVLQCNVKSSNELLEISNALYEKSGLVDWSEPEFYSNFKPATDPLYNDQYYLKNTGQYGGVVGIDINIEPAWSITTGSNTIRVAVIDEGVEDHEDFSGRVLSGFTAGSTTGIGVPQNGVKGHGVACTGIIAASHDNNLGIKGIAPNVRIVPINIFPNTPVPFINPGGAATNQEIAAAIDWAWSPNYGSADVLSCSWGGGSQSNDIDAAIGRARTQGRMFNGVARGCPVIFSSGNNGNIDVGYPGNVDGVITVGSCNNAPPAGDIGIIVKEGLQWI